MFKALNPASLDDILNRSLTHIYAAQLAVYGSFQRMYLIHTVQKKNNCIVYVRRNLNAT